MLWCLSQAKPEDKDNEEQCTQKDSHISKVESRPLKTAPLDINKVRHTAKE